MKKIIAATLLTSIFSATSMAGPIGTVTSTTIVGITVNMPEANVVQCLEDMDDACLGITSGYVLTTSTAVLLKEDMKAVEGDAIGFLAGAPKTLALEEVINTIRSEDEKSEDHSDVEIVSAMLKSI